MSIPTRQDAMKLLDVFDPGVADLLRREEKRQFKTLSLIASEDMASPLASCLEGSTFTNKNTEGYPGKHFVGECRLSDQAEILVIERVKEVSGAEHANIQSGNVAVANMTVLTGLLNLGDTFLGLTLDSGEHLSHSAKFRYSGHNFNVLYYGIDKETGMIDMNQVRQIALKNKPKLIMIGASSCLRIIDYKAFHEICDEVGTYFWVDCAHGYGLIAGDVIPSPVSYADVVTTSTQRTLRGPRGYGVILCGEEFTAKLDRGVFPRLQGSPGGDMLAACGVLFLELLQPEPKTYTHQVCTNAKALAQGCQEEDMRTVTGGTNTHMVILDVAPVIVNGQETEDLLSSIGTVANKNMVPYDTPPPNLGSGLRVSSPIMTTREAKEEGMKHIGHLLGRTLSNRNDPAILVEIEEEIYKIATSHPVFSNK